MYKYLILDGKRSYKNAINEAIGRDKSEIFNKSPTAINRLIIKLNLLRKLLQRIFFLIKYRSFYAQQFKVQKEVKFSGVLKCLRVEGLPRA